MNKASEPRFGFGRNWQNYSKTLSEEQIQAAIESLRSSLGVNDLDNLRILDAGCGSGLFSLAACRLGASEVIAFDYDCNSVSCAQDLNQRFGPFTNWTVTQGDVLDQQFINTLGMFDIVYSWGVLHHTGNMWQALENVCSLVKPGGSLFISIYNDQGWISRVWRMVKQFYVSSPHLIQLVMAISWYLTVVCVRIISGCWHKKPFHVWFKSSGRGMNLWHDAVDWIGGYPFETASLKALKIFLQSRCFLLINTLPKTGMGCNQLVARKIQSL